MMAELEIKELSQNLQSAIAGLQKTEGLESAGIVIRVGDGVAWVHGLSKAGYSEVLEIDTKNGVVEAFALNLMEDEIGARPCKAEHSESPVDISRQSR
jgi:F-type H+-transporting ATPase subunit alpha